DGAAKAMAEGFERGEPFHGYYFKVLTGQGPSARLGQMDYVVEGAMIGGFALVAWPAEYRGTGVQTFIGSWDGGVYQKDLGPDTTKIASAMKLYDPDKTEPSYRMLAEHMRRAPESASSLFDDKGPNRC